MRDQFSLTLRIISTIVLVLFIWTFGGIFDIAYAIKNSEELGVRSEGVKTSSQQSALSGQQPTKKSEQKFQETLEKIEEVLADTVTDTDTKKSNLRNRKTEIVNLDVEIRKQFKETEGKIKDLPEGIKQRHRDFVKKYDDNLNELRSNLDAIDKAKDKVEVEAKVEKAKKHLEKVRPPKRHQKLDPNKLPHRTAEPVWIEPRTKPEEFEKDSDQRLVFSSQFQDKISPNPSLLKRGTGAATEFNPAFEKNSASFIPTLEKGGKGGFSDKNTKPLLVAANGSLKGLLNSTPPPRPLATPPYQGGVLWENSVSSPYQGEGRRGDVSELPSFQSSALASNSTEMLLALADPPTSADLAETIEVQFTPEIHAKAAELGHNPVKIYNWVRNNIEYVPTYGSIQGADYCLQTKLCNDTDTASLLIAMLRVSGIHAKYVYGTIELPIEKVKNWAGGFTDSMESLRLFASAGVPTKGMTVGGAIQYVRLEHVYVEAWIDYIPSRGARHKVGDMWIPLDASFKQYNYTQGIDIKSAVPFDAQTFINQIQSTATINEQAGYVTGVNSSLIQQTMTDYQTQVQNYISQHYPNATVGDVLGKKEIIKQEFSVIPGTLPYKTIVTGAKYSSLPDSLRHRLTFEIYKDVYDEILGTKITVTKSLPELAGKRISLNYMPATEADKNLLNSYVQNYATSVPAYLVNLKAELKIDNTVIATGPSVTMGNDQILNLTFTSPTKSEIETHLMVAGDYNVIGLNIGGAKELFKKRITQGDFADPVSEMLYKTILAYWTEYDTLKDMKAKTYKIASVRLPSEGLSTAPVNIKYMFGTPFSGYYAGRGLDIKRDIEVVFAVDGNKDNAIAFNQAAGIIGSFLEGSIFDQLFKNKNGDGLSTVRILNLANNQGIPIYNINSNNIIDILPTLQVSDDVINDIRNAVNAGKEVITPQQNINQNGWTGTGYIISNPNDGTGGYIISGGTSGGVFMYAADMYAAMAVDETPFSPGILNSVYAWMGFVGAPAIEEIEKQIGIDLKKLAEEAASGGSGDGAGAKKVSSLKALRVLAIAALVAVFVLVVLKTETDDDIELFRHYTKIENKILIMAEMKIRASTRPGLDLGPGVYLADIRTFFEPDGIDGPNTKLIATRLRMPIENVETYIEMWIDRKRRPLIIGDLVAPEFMWQYCWPADLELAPADKAVIVVK